MEAPSFSEAFGARLNGTMYEKIAIITFNFVIILNFKEFVRLLHTRHYVRYDYNAMAVRGRHDTHGPLTLKAINWENVHYALLQKKGSITNVSTHYGRATAQAVSRRPPTAEAWVRSWVSPSGICGGQSGTGTDFSPHT
jgi:hypothetical protein